VRPPLSLTRVQILAFRRRVGALNERLARGADSLRMAAWAGLQDSMPRAALLSLHARVRETSPTAWADPSLVQIWGPRYSAYVVADQDRAVFTLGRLPEQAKGRQRAEQMATRLREHLAGERLPYDEIGRALEIHPNALRYAATTGTVLIHWDGARRPLVWSVAEPDIEPADARRELVRRYLHVFGPATCQTFAAWAGVSQQAARNAFTSLAGSLLGVETPIGSAWILDSDEPLFGLGEDPVAPARLLPSGDAYFLHQKTERELLVPDPSRRAELWTQRVWPGAVMLDGEIRGTWRRAEATVTVHAWGRLSRAHRQAIEAEASAMPLPGLEGHVRIHWGR
jgi:Winged helix DNA-binding domain